MYERFTPLALLLCAGLLAPPATAQLNEDFESYGNGFGLTTPVSAFLPWQYYGHNYGSWRPRMMHRADPDPLFTFPTTNLDPESHGGAPNDHYIKIYANPGSSGTGAGTAGTPGDPNAYHRGIYRQLPTPIQPGCYKVYARINVNYPGSTGQTMGIRTKAVLADMVQSWFYMNLNWQNDPGNIPGAEEFYVDSRLVNTATLDQTWFQVGGTIEVNAEHEAFYLDIQFREMQLHPTTFSYRLDDLRLIPCDEGMAPTPGTDLLPGQKKRDQNLLTAPFIAPNPTVGAFAVYTPGLPANLPVEVFAADGRAVHSTRTHDSGRLDLDLTAEPAGLYTVRIAAPDGDTLLRVMKE